MLNNNNDNNKNRTDHRIITTDDIYIFCIS